ncbi:MAG: thioredoxin family protein [Magnetospirillum sp.]|nr:thioredoxin family protein [Magnetospirillum sp.]
MSNALARYLAVLLLLAGRAVAAEPGASEWVDNDAGAVRLIAAVTAAGDASSIPAGVQFRLGEGWKIYWRTPGDAGYPPKIDWSGSTNIGTPVLSWPAPKRFVLAGLQNHGYAGTVVLPVEIPLAHPGAAVRLAATVDYLACSQVCVPMQARLALDLPAGPAAPSAAVHELGRFAALVPGDGARHGLAVASAGVSGDGNDAVLHLEVTASEPFAHPDAFVEAPDVANFDQPRLSLEDGGRRARFAIPVVPGTVAAPLPGQRMTVTVVDGMRAMEASVVPAAIAAPAPAVLPSLLAIAAVALLGGLILNLMPCVLPVLSIKVLGALSHGGAERHHVRAAFLASAAGIVASFLALGAAAIAAKAAGQAVGWGIQFQQPWFLAAMIGLLSLFAANLWGLFEIRLPSWLLSRGPGGTPHHTVLGHFLSGAFATLLATPCSAPFLGTAIGFALAGGPVEIVTIFAALGIGMAGPYLAVAAWPDAARRLPKPGRWMVRLRRAMGVALALTALWLGSVLVAQTGTAAAPSASATWRPFDRAAIPGLVGAGKVVFVDVTADWCITCKVNKAAVLDHGAVAAALNGPGVVAMRADWTRPDDGIAAYLAGHGRYGIPFNAVYGPAAPNGIPLSELLTEADTLAALVRAAGP